MTKKKKITVGNNNYYNSINCDLNIILFLNYKY